MTDSTVREILFTGVRHPFCPLIIFGESASVQKG